MAMKAHVAPWKRQEVSDLTTILTDHPVLAVVNFTDIPASSIQKIRAGLRGKAVVRASKNNLIQLALEDADKRVPGVKQLSGSVSGETAIVGTELNPFQLFRQFKTSRTHAAARPNQIAPFDIAVEKGDTPFKPGPVVGDLQKAGIPAAIEGGKVVIRAYKVVAKEGERISPDLASALDKLGIHPIEIGLDVVAVYEDGLVYGPEVLDVDEVAFQGQLSSAIQRAMGLALDRAWLTPQTVGPLLTKAARNALAVGVETGYITKETVTPILSKAYMQMLAVAKLAKGEALDDELKAVLGAAPPAAPAKAEAERASEKEEEPEEEEVSEEEAAGGLGALFG